MADYALTGRDLKRHIKIARTTPLAFAYNPGAPKEVDYFALHRKRTAEQLSKTAKKYGPSAKAAYGSAQVDGKVLELRCELVLPAMARKLKQHLKANQVTINVRIMDADGNVLEEDIEDIADDPELFSDDQDLKDDPETDTDDGGDDGGDLDEDIDDEDIGQDQKASTEQETAEIVAGLKRIQPVVMAAPEAVADKLKGAMTKVVGHIKANEIPAARETFDNLDAAVTKLMAYQAKAAQPATPEAPEAPESKAEPEPQPQTDDARLKALIVRAEELKEGIAVTKVPDAVRTKLETALQTAAAALKTGNLDQAETIMGKIAEALTRLGMGSDSIQQSKSKAKDAKDKTPDTADAQTEPGQTTPDPAAPASPGDDFDQKAHDLKERVESLRTQMTVRFGVEVQGALDERLDLAVKDLEAGIYSSAGPAMTFVQDAMRLQDAIDALMPDYTRAASTGAVEDVSRMRILFDSALELVPGPDHAKAWAYLQQVQTMIAEGAENNTNAFMADIPEDVRRFAMSRLNWTSARTRMKGEMDKLRDTIAQTISGDPEYSEILDNLGELYTYIEGLDLRLADRLDAIVNAEQGPERETRKTEARAVLREYLDELSQPFFQDVDSGNGFANVNVAATARSALDDIDRELAA
ncbi:hypothetical protein LA6_004502 [Marinibacterium anthonyi]|nr:hypothetical protein LA6_004502 [Marinibacterium anthonyi]